MLMADRLALITTVRLEITFIWPLVLFAAGMLRLARHSHWIGLAIEGMKKVAEDVASSKRCSACHYQLSELALSVREWQCPSCDAQHQRDVNAAINL